MTKHQWAAIYDYCAEYGCTRSEMLADLKADGTVPQDARLIELGRYAGGTTYEAMKTFLEERR